MFRNVALQSLSFASSCQRLRWPMWAMNQDKICAAQTPRIVLQILADCAEILSKILTSVVCHKETNPICRTMLSASTVGAQKDQECHEVKGEATPQGPWPSCTPKMMKQYETWSFFLNHETANQQPGSISSFKSGTQSTLLIDYVGIWITKGSQTQQITNSATQVSNSELWTFFPGLSLLHPKPRTDNLRMSVPHLR